MNEKIKQLLLDAGGQYSSGNQNDWPSWILGDVGVNKFAEMIIKECANVCRQEWVADSSVQRYGDQCANSIEQYFNIKETV